MNYGKAYKEALERAKNLRKDAIAYKEALERAREIIKDAIDMGENIRAKQCEIIFPELKESEDERIRKAVIEMIHDTPNIECEENYNVRKEDVIAWLEKQGSPNSYSGTSFKYNGHTWGMCARDGGVEILVDGKIKERVFLGNKPQSKTALEASKEEKVDNQNCVNPTDMVEPKFKVGDWVVYERSGDTYQIHSIDDSDSNYIRYICKPLLCNNNDTPCFYEEMIHLWTIQDAKDGDVLMSRAPFIYGKQCPYGGLNWYNGKFIKASNYVYTDSPVHPATKEQRDLLFQKMKEAGYEWDSEKKESKKIKEGKASFANRQLYNRAILKILSNYVEKYPDTRFGQMLYNLGISSGAENNFYVESSKMYQNINAILKEQKNGKNRII